METAGPVAQVLGRGDVSREAFTPLHRVAGGVEDSIHRNCVVGKLIEYGAWKAAYESPPVGVEHLGMSGRQPANALNTAVKTAEKLLT